MYNKEILFGTILSYVQQGASVLLGLLYTPFLLSRLGQSEYGLYSSVNATIMMLNLLSFGLANGYIRYYSKYKKNNDEERKYRLNGMFLSIFTVIGIIALLAGLFIANNLSLVFKNGFNETEYVIAKRLAIIFSVSLAVSLPASVFSAIVAAHEKFIVAKFIGVLRTILAPLISIPLLFFGFKSTAVVMVSAGVSIFSDLCFVAYATFKLKEKFIFSDYEKGLLKGILIYTFPIALNAIVDQVNLNIDKVLLGRYRGTSDVSVYNIGYTLYALYMQISISISTLFTPRVHDIVNKYGTDTAETKSQFTALFTKVGRMQCEILLLVLTGMIFFGKPFIVNFWVGESYNDSYFVLLLLAVPGTIHLIQNLGVEIQRAQNRHLFCAVAYVVMAVLNLGISILLCPKYGPIGCAFGTALSFVLCNAVVMNIYYHKRCNIDIFVFWKNILRILLSIVPPVAIWLLIRNFLDMTSLPLFIAGVIIYTVLYCTSLWLLGMNSEEKTLVKNVFKSFIDKFSAKNK